MHHLLKFVSTMGLALALTGLLVGCPGLSPGARPSSVVPDDEEDQEDQEDQEEEPAKSLHEKIFVDVLGVSEYQGTASSCLICHSDHARDILDTAHWNWQGAADNIAGLEGEQHGKQDLMNSY